MISGKAKPELNNTHGKAEGRKTGEGFKRVAERMRDN